jgi:hypothetical protein
MRAAGVGLIAIGVFLELPAAKPPLREAGRARDHVSESTLVSSEVIHRGAVSKARRKPVDRSARRGTLVSSVTEKPTKF